MKKVVVILFSLVLLLSQSLFFGGAAAQLATTEGRHCGCDTQRCCVNKSAPESSSLPLAPVRSNNPSQSIWLQIWAATSFTLPAPSASKLSSVSYFIPKAGSAPLYQQNCAYLL